MTQFLNIDPAALAALMDKPSVLLVDVRNHDEVARGMIANALHIPLSMLAVEYATLPKQEEIVFYCHSGVRSAMAAEFAMSHGTPQAYNLTGGVIAWARAGYSFVQQT